MSVAKFFKNYPTISKKQDNVTKNIIDLSRYVRSSNDILTENDMERGSYNDGHRISKTKANRIASRLRNLDKNGSIMKYESEYKEYLRSLPREDCNICEGTGVREDEIGMEAREKDEEYKCNGCLGKGKRDNFGTHYPFESEEVMRFAEFCEQSGGFEIC